MSDQYIHIHARDLSPTRGAQNQVLQAAVNSAVAPVARLSGGLVRMPGGHYAQLHTHEQNEIILHVYAGVAATLIGDQLESVIHSPGSVMWISPGVKHAAVNLDTAAEVLAFEVRTDPTFEQDTVVCPGMAADVADRVAELQQRYTAGEFDAELAGDPVRQVVTLGGGHR